MAGRSNAINIAQRLGIPNAILDDARKLYGAASAEINEVMVLLQEPVPLTFFNLQGKTFLRKD